MAIRSHILLKMFFLYYRSCLTNSFPLGHTSQDSSVAGTEHKRYLWELCLLLSLNSRWKYASGVIKIYFGCHWPSIWHHQPSTLVVIGLAYDTINHFFSLISPLPAEEYFGIILPCHNNNNTVFIYLRMLIRPVNHRIMESLKVLGWKGPLEVI